MTFAQILAKLKMELKADDLFNLVENLQKNDAHISIGCLDSVAAVLIALDCQCYASKSDEIKFAYLKAVGALFYGRANLFFKYHVKFLGTSSILAKYLNCADDTIRGYAVVCMSDIILGQHLDSRTEDWCFTLCYSIVKDDRYFRPDFSSVKILCGAWESIKILMEINYQPERLEPAEWFNHLAKSMLFGLRHLAKDGADSNSANESMGSSVNNQLFFRPFSWNAKRRKIEANEGKINDCVEQVEKSIGDDQDQLFVSEDQNFDVEKRKLAHKIDKSPANQSKTCENRSLENCRYKQIRIRTAALRIFALCTRFIPKKLLLGRWFDFFPDSQTPSSRGDVLTALADEPDRRCRSLALSACRHWVDACREMLAKAEQCKKNRPFVSFSEKLALSILNVHKAIVATLQKEKHSSVIVECLKTLKYLLDTLKYENLDETLLTDLVASCQAYLSASDQRIKAASLALYSSLLDGAASKNFCHGESLVNLLFETCLACATNALQLQTSVGATSGDQLAEESVKLLTKLCRNYSHLSCLYLDELLRLTTGLLKKASTVEHSSAVLLHGISLVNELLNFYDFVGRNFFDEIIVEIGRFFVNPAKFDVSVVVEALSFVSKCLSERLIGDPIQRGFKQPILSLCGYDLQQLEYGLLKFLPTMVETYSEDLTFCRSVFDFTFRTLTGRSANMAEKAGDSLVHLTRKTVACHWPSAVLQRDVTELLFHTVCQATRIAADQTVVQRVKPPCLNVAALFLDYGQKLASTENCTEIQCKMEAVYNAILPTTAEHCRSTIIKVQKMALECAANLFTAFSYLSQKSGACVQNPKILLQSTTECLRQPAIKIRNKFLAAKSLCSVSERIWREQFSDLFLDTCQAMVDCLLRLDNDATVIGADQASKETAVIEVVRAFVHLLAFCQSDQLFDLHQRLINEPNVGFVQKHFDSFKMSLKRDFSAENISDLRCKLSIDQRNYSQIDFELFVSKFHSLYDPIEPEKLPIFYALLLDE